MGAPEQRPLLDRHTHTRAPRFREPKRLRSFGKLLKHPTSKDDVPYLNHRLLAMVSIGYRLWSIWAAVVQGVGLYGLCGLWLPACGDLVKGCALSTFMGIPNCRETPHAARSRRATVNLPMARRGVVGAASQNRHDSNHEETGKGDPLWGLNSAVGVRPNHGGSGAISW